MTTTSSPHEGYCPACKYLIDLDATGRLTVHGSRNIFLNGSVTGRTDPCTASGAYPVTILFADDPKVAFTSEMRTGRCAVCKKTDVVATELNGRAYMTWHGNPQISQDGSVCPGAWDAIEYVAEL